MTVTESARGGDEPLGLCEHLAHAANGWPATHRVRRADGPGTVDVCDMCITSWQQPQAHLLPSVNSWRRLLRIDVGTTQPLTGPAPRRVTARAVTTA